ncbi:MAG: ChaN family lipoprotein [Bacteroidota bacterium]
MQKMLRFWLALLPLSSFGGGLGLFLVCSVAGYSLTSAQSMAPRDYRIFDNAAQKEITLAELADAGAEAQVIFFGEQHNDSIGHVVQAELYRELLARYGDVSLSLEMFETDCQLVLDEYLDGHIPERNFIKDSRPWDNYKTAYRPLVEAARGKGQKVVAANAPRRYVSLVGKKTQSALKKLDAEARAYLPPLPFFAEDEDYLERFQEAMGGGVHTVSPAFFQAQCLWDASMGYRIYRHWKKHKPRLILHLNGSFHTDYRQGTINQLRRYGKKMTYKNISSSTVPDVDGYRPRWEQQMATADYTVVTRPFR